MLFSYKTRQFFRRALRTLVVLALILAISLVFFAVWLRRFVVYTPDGVRIDFSATEPADRGVIPSKPDRLDIFIEYWHPEETRPDAPVIVQKRLEGYYVPSEMLQKNIPALREQLALLPAGTAVLLDLKSFWGYFYYSSDYGILSDSYDIGAVDALIADLDAFDLHLIARLPALRDYEYARNHTSSGLPTKKGYLWTDDSGCYWLDPTDDDTLFRLMNIAKELRDMGFDEVVFKDFYVPESNKIVFDADRKEAIEAAAATLVTACATDSFTVSFLGYRTDLVLPAGNCRLYLEGVAAVDVPDVLAQTQVADKRLQVVLLAQTNDTRYDVCGTLRPLDLAH
jgi:hypothetical protein